MRLILVSCEAAMQYNPATHDVHIMAKTIKEVSDKISRKEDKSLPGFASPYTPFDIKMLLLCFVRLAFDVRGS